MFEKMKNLKLNNKKTLKIVYVQSVFTVIIRLYHDQIASNKGTRV